MPPALEENNNGMSTDMGKSEPNMPAKTSIKKAVKTNDNTNLFVYSTVFIASIALIALLVKNRKSKVLSLFLAAGILVSASSFTAFAAAPAFGEVVNLEKDTCQSFDYTVEDMEGYEYVGYVIKFKEPAENPEPGITQPPAGTDPVDPPAGTDPVDPPAGTDPVDPPAETDPVDPPAGTDPNGSPTVDEAAVDVTGD